MRGITSYEDLGVSNDKVVNEAVAAIREGKVKALKDGMEDPDGHLYLPTGYKWPIATNNILYVRKYYKPLYENVLEKLAFNQVEKVSF